MRKLVTPTKDWSRGACAAVWALIAACPGFNGLLHSFGKNLQDLSADRTREPIPNARIGRNSIHDASQVVAINRAHSPPMQLAICCVRGG